MAELGRLTAVFDADTSRFEAGSRRVRNASDKAADQVKRDAAKINNSIKQMGLSFGAGIAGGMGVGFLASQLKQAGMAVLQFSSNLENSKIAFTTMLGSVQAATAHLKELKDFALTTPFEFEGLVDASKRMQALGFRSKEVIPILTDVGNAVASVGGSAEVLDRVVLALSQMQAKGKVSAQEMNQLAEAGIPAWRILSEHLKKSTAEVMDLAEKGKVSSAVFIEAFQKFSQANFGGLMEKQSKTFMGAMSNIHDSLMQVSSEALEPFFTRISAGALEIGNMTSAVGQNQTAMQQWKSDLEQAISGATKLGTAVSALAGQITGLSNVPIPVILSVLGSITGLPAIFGGLKALGDAPKGTPVDPTDPMLSFIKGLKPGTGGGGAGKGSGGSKVAKLSEGQQLLNSLTEEYNRLQEELNDLSKVDIVQKELQKEKYKNLGDKLREQIEEMATYITMDTKSIEVKKKQTEALESVDEFIKKQNQAIVEAALVGDEWDNEIRELTASLKEAGAKIDAVKFATLSSNYATLKAIDLAKKEAEAMQGLNIVRQRYADILKNTRDRMIEIRDADPRVTDLGGGSYAISQNTPSVGDLGTSTRQRRATSEGQIMEAELARIREQMMGLGQEITGIFSRSVGDGFEQGAKRGLATLALGLLDIIQNIFLKKLAEGLGNLFSGLATGGGGGGFWGGLLKSALGAATGGLSGGVGGLGGAAGKAGMMPFAQGGYVPGTGGFDSVPAMLTPGELVLNKRQQEGMGSTVNNYHINLPPAPRGGYSSPKSRRQQAEQIVAAIQGASA